ncbi:LysR family transcriptional regulator [Parvibacter caecicola]|uniref:LysR family transcriptional regulator n=1 Tax=Parvibacter caecicola TaxID=747645 RepID=UPI0027320A30|nr:LysR family transcriptional regulator [Parvibacter caecicola]
MDIRYFQEFIELSNRLNFRDAAKKLCMSQSTLSKHISAMEREYGVKLFRRDRHEVALTEAGVTLLGQALGIWGMYEESLAAASSMREAASLNVCGLLGSPNENATTLQLIGRLRNQTPSISLHVVRCISNVPTALAALLRQNEADCVLAFGLSNSIATWDGADLFSVNPIWRAPLYLVVSSASALAAKTAYTAEDLIGGNFIHLAGPLFTPTWNQIKLLLEQRGIPHTVKPIATSSVYDYSNLELGNCLMLMPAGERPALENNPNYTIIPPADPSLAIQAEEMHLAQNTGPSIETFIKTLREVYGSRE